MVILALLLGLQFTPAYWNSEAIDMVDRYQVGIDDHGFVDSYESSFWGSVKSRWFQVRNIKHAKISVEGVFKNEVPIIYNLEGKTRSRRGAYDPRTKRYERETYFVTEQRPLIIYIPGIFNNANSSQSRRAYYSFKKAGYHFISLPNPWSDSYIKANPMGAKPGDILNEAYSLRKAIDVVVDFVGTKNITHIELVGASYGAFIASMIQAFESPQNPLFERATVFGPPLDFRYSIPFIDEQMLSVSESEVDDPNLFDSIKFFFDFLFARSRSDINEKHLEQAKPYTIKLGFKGELLNSIKTYEKVHGLNWIPKFKNQEERKDWEDKFVFKVYFENFAPEILSILQSEFAFLDYWLQTAKASGFHTRVFTADNDFLNPPYFPTKFTFASYDKSSYLQIPTGGHLGFLAFPWFEDFSNLIW